MEFLDAPPLPFHFTPDHEQFRASLREFVAREITPFVNAWDEAETFPRALYARAAEQARAAGWPDEVWKTWRYRRASLARVLANDHMMQAVAESYQAVRAASAARPPED